MQQVSDQYVPLMASSSPQETVRVQQNTTAADNHGYHAITAYGTARSIGLIFGIVIQFSTIGADFMIASVLGEERLNESKNNIVVIFSFIWSFLISGIAIVILRFLREIIMASSSSSSSAMDDDDDHDLVNYYDDDDDEQDDESSPTSNVEQQRRRQVYIMNRKLIHVEYRFVVGALIGVSMSWILTDALLGMKIQIIYCFLTLFMALIICHVLLSLFVGASNNKKTKRIKSVPLV